ncbi:type II secretion system protein [Patescibacteria group bacterium]|nr:type II secretion system protein [Patescibacteria group bacterium]
MKKGFTLIELLVVIAIIAILAVVVFVALDPATRFADARNSRRTNDVNNILTAVHECIIDNDGILSTCGISTSLATTQLGTCASGGATLCSGAAAACLDLSGATVLGPYLSTIPEDPTDGSAATTAYTIALDANNIVTITACSAENAETIQVSR